MPRETDCPDCGGEGTVEGLEFRCYGGEPTEIKTEEECETCEGEGKITVYTQTEINKAVQDERESCVLICEVISRKHWVDYKWGNNRADLHYQGLSMGAEECEEAIRERNK